MKREATVFVSRSRWQMGDPTVNDVGKQMELRSFAGGREQCLLHELSTRQTKFVKVKVKDTLAGVTQLPEKIAILQPDMWDRLVPGGVLIFDGFCQWNGARQAVTCDRVLCGETGLECGCDCKKCSQQVL
jgi:hypothetical protein